MVRVLILDDHQILASSLAMVLDAESDLSVEGTGRPPRGGAPAHRGPPAPNVVLLDHRLPDGDGVGALRELRALHPSAQVVVLTASDADHVLVAAVEAGAAGFLSKSGSIEKLKAAVRAAAVGESVISPELLARLLSRMHQDGGKAGAPLTECEREVPSLVSEGLSTRPSPTVWSSVSTPCATTSRASPPSWVLTRSSRHFPSPSIKDWSRPSEPAP